MLAMTALAEIGYTVSYQGFPYMRTNCELPTYKPGDIIKLPAIPPQSANYSGKPAQKPADQAQSLLWFNGWRYDGVLYEPEALFTMPAADVVFIPDYAPLGLKQTHNANKAQKKLQDGQLIIVRDGAQYNVLGIRIK